MASGSPLYGTCVRFIVNKATVTAAMLFEDVEYAQRRNQEAISKFDKRHQNSGKVVIKVFAVTTDSLNCVRGRRRW